MTTTMRRNLGAPPAIEPRPAVDLPSVRGHRVIVDAAEGHVRDLRAASDVWNDFDGPVVLVVDEATWYQWSHTPPDQRTERPPRARAVPAEMVYVEL